MSAHPYLLKICIHLQLTPTQPHLTTKWLFTDAKFHRIFHRIKDTVSASRVRNCLFFFSNDMFYLRSGSKTHIDKGCIKRVKLVWRNNFSYILIREFISRTVKRFIFSSFLPTIILALFRDWDRRIFLWMRKGKLKVRDRDVRGLRKIFWVKRSGWSF